MARLTERETRAALAELAARRAPLVAAKADVNRRLADLMRQLAPLIALADVYGIPRSEIARLARVSRQTVYQVLDGGG